MKHSFYLLISLQLLNALLAINAGNANTRLMHDQHQLFESRQNRIGFNHELSLDDTDIESPERRDKTIFELDNPSSSAMLRSNEQHLSETGCSSDACLNEGICTETQTGFECKCPWGWTGSRCEICLTECASNPCPANKKCKAKYGGGFECVCPADRAGLNCEIQNDLCSSNPCLNDGVCKPVEGGSFTCVCQKPWAGENCEKIWENPCTEEVLRSTEMVQFSDPWERTSYLVCTDINIYHSMSCSVGTYFNDKLRHCVPEGYDPPTCPDKHCKNDADCILDENNNFRCICKKGFRGELCEENIDECALGGTQACAGGVCVDQVNGYYCTCPNGIGLDCKNTIVNPCTAENLVNHNEFHGLKSEFDNVFLHCISEKTFVVNKCPENLFWHPEEKTCTVDRPLVKSGNCLSFPCKNAGECHDNGDGSFKCVCKVGYTGDFCENMIDFCLSNPCQNGGRCLPFAGGYTCVCPDKIIDECCCHGIINPCPPKSKLIPGVNNYFPHLFPNRYLHCDFDGRAFARNCAAGLRWRQELLSCMPGDASIESVNGVFANSNRTSKLVRINNPVSQVPVTKATAASPIRVVAETVQPVLVQSGLPQLAPPNSKTNRVSRPPQQYNSYASNNNYHEFSQAARQNNILRDEVKQAFRMTEPDMELDHVEDQQKQAQELQKQQEQILAQQQLVQQQQQQVQQQQLQQQQQLEQQQQRDKQQQEQDKKQRELELQRQQQQLEEQRKQIQQQQELLAQQQQLQQQQDQQKEEEMKKHLQQMNNGQPILQDEEDQTIIDKMKQELDRKQQDQNQREQQFQLQVQQQQQEQQRLQIEQQRQQIAQQFAFQKQQTLQEQQEQQRQQKIQSQFQQQLKQAIVQQGAAQSPRMQTSQTEQQPLEFDQTVAQMKQDRDQRQKIQDQKEQQFQLQVQQQQQEQQRLQIEQQRQQIAQQFAFQKQQTLQEQQEQQRQQKIQSQFQQQLKQQQQQQQLPSSVRLVQPAQLEEDQLTIKMKQDLDRKQQEQNQKEQQFQLQVQQQQQEQQRLQMEQQRQQIMQQFAFQKQQTLQEQQEQQRQQKIQSQFQQQLNPNKQQLPQSFRSIDSVVPEEGALPIPIANLNQGYTAGSVLSTPATPKVAFSKSSNLYFKPTFTSARKQPLFRSYL